MRKRKESNKPSARTDTSTKGRKTAVKKKAERKKRVRVERTRNAGTMTESEFFSMIRSALRSKSRFWKPRLRALEGARRPSQNKNRRLKWEFQCAYCEDWFPQTQMEVHHDTPAGELRSLEDLPGFVERLFCEDGWLCLCKGCHAAHHEADKKKKKAA